MKQYRVTREWADGDQETFRTSTPYQVGEVVSTLGAGFTVVAIEEIPFPPCCFLFDDPPRRHSSIRKDLAYCRTALSSIRAHVAEKDYSEAIDLANEIYACMATMIEDLEHLQHSEDRNEQGD